MKRIISALMILVFSIFLISCTIKDESVLQSIEVSPYIEFNEGEFDVSKINITLKYDKKTETIKATSENISSSELNSLKEPGIYKVTINYQEYSASICVSIKASNNTYFVKVVDYDGNIISENEYSSSVLLEEPTHNEITGYDFLGWFDQNNNLFDFTKEISSNTLLQATYEIHKFSVKFYVHNELYETQAVPYGEKATNPKEPTEDGAIFMGWSIELQTNPIFEDTEVFAKFQRTNNKVYVRFLVNGEVVNTQEVKYGEAALDIDTSSYEGFVSWDKDILVPLFEDTDFNAIIKLNVTISYYLNDDLFATEVIKHNTVPAGVDTSKIIGFAGWDKDLTKPVTDDLEVHAIFKDNVTIKYYVNGELYKEQSVPIGYIPQAIDTEEIPDFYGWDVDLTRPCYFDLVVNAILKEKVKVTFKVLDEEYTIDVYLGEKLEPLEVTEIDSNYEFVKWDYDFNLAINEEITIEAIVKAKIEYVFDKVKDDYIPLLYGNGLNKTIETDFYSKQGFSGYTLKINDNILFLTNVYVIEEESESYITAVKASSSGTLYINKTGESLKVNLSQIRCVKKDGYNIVVCNEIGNVFRILNNGTDTEVVIPANGFLWSPGFNDSTNGTSGLGMSLINLVTANQLEYTNWGEKIKVTYQNSFEEEIGSEYIYPGNELTYPELKEVDGYRFLDWSSHKLVVTDTIIKALYIEYPPKEVTLTVINGSGSGTYIAGERAHIKADTIKNKEFSYWISGGVKVGTSAEMDIDIVDTATYVAHYIDKTTLVNLVVEGKSITYRNSSTYVRLPDALTDNLYGLRAAWVSAITDCVEKFKNEKQYKANITEMLDVLEHYNFNAVMFHIRVYNDAYYPSKLNPKSVNMDTDLDMLEWTITECHKRGIEFHAWMNPYRVKSSGGTDVNSVAQSIKARCPANIGSNPDMLLLGNSGGVILNPGLPEVRKFLVDTCMEVVENYDVDAIHFDDYFYIDGVDDSSTRAKYNKDNLSTKDFRRQQVDIFIEDLSNAVRAYNRAHNKFVQIGISPSGIWRNGNGQVTYDEYGNAISNGSYTSGMEHWGGYLFSDTVNWINHEWIDYIMPQTYWAFTHKTAPYADLMEWWDNIVRYKNVKLYSGIGIYMASNGGNYSWGTNPTELLQQLTYIQKFENVSGACMFKFQYIRQYYKGTANTYFTRMFDNFFPEHWLHPALPPEITSANTPLSLPGVTGLKVTQSSGKVTITFNSVVDARKYAVFRTDGILDYRAEELIKVVGNLEGQITVTDTLPYHGYFTYYVIPISGSNTQGIPKSANLEY